MPIATPDESWRLNGARVGRLVSAESGLSGLFLTVIFARRPKANTQIDDCSLGLGIKILVRLSRPQMVGAGGIAWRLGTGFRRGFCPEKLRDVASRDEATMKRRDQVRKMMV